jgi:hypothetical protein
VDYTADGAFAPTWYDTVVVVSQNP